MDFFFVIVPNLRHATKTPGKYQNARTIPQNILTLNFPKDSRQVFVRSVKSDQIQSFLWSVFSRI